MAIYHFSAQVLGRAPKKQKDGSVRPGSSAVAAAAYRAGERLKAAGRDDGEETVPARVHDYTKRSGVSHAEVMVPPGAADWLGDRELLWNTVEAMEVRKDAQLAREINAALPYELDHAQRVELVREFVLEQFVSRGMVADFALHDPDPERGMSEKNYHTHIMLTLRQATAKGLHPVKTREWNSRDELKGWRVAWQDACNDALARAGKRVRVDHRTLTAQRADALKRGDVLEAAKLDRKPELHQGPQARQAVRRGYQVQSGPREVGPRWHRERQADGQYQVVPGRRVVDGRRFDQGTRLSWFDQLLIGDSAELRTKFEKIDRQAARFNRKLIYWTRRVEFWASGQVMGKEFRFNRWKAAEEEAARKEEAKRRMLHALKRRNQAEAIGRMLADLLSGRKAARERGKNRQREMELWRLRPVVNGRDLSRGRVRARTKR